MATDTMKDCPTPDWFFFQFLNNGIQLWHGFIYFPLQMAGLEIFGDMNFTYFVGKWFYVAELYTSSSFIIRGFAKFDEAGCQIT